MKSSQPLVSICIPNYNGSKYLAEALDSALKQSYKNIEVVVVDDGSNDNSIDILDDYSCKYGDQIVCVRQDHKGAPAARNKAISIAKGDYIKFLDSDDVLVFDCIDWQVETVQKLPDNAIPFGVVVFSRSDLSFDNYSKRTSYSPNGESYSEDTAIRVSWFVRNGFLTSAPLHKKKYLLKVGGFNESLRRGQEYDLHIRLAFAGLRFKGFNKVVAYHRGSDGRAQIGLEVGKKWNQYKKRELFPDIGGMIINFYGDNVPKEIETLAASEIWRSVRINVEDNSINEAKKRLVYARRVDPHYKYILKDSNYDKYLYHMYKLMGPIKAEILRAKIKDLKIYFMEKYK